MKTPPMRLNWSEIKILCIASDHRRKVYPQYQPQIPNKKKRKIEHKSLPTIWNKWALTEEKRYYEFNKRKRVRERKGYTKQRHAHNRGGFTEVMCSGSSFLHSCIHASYARPTILEYLHAHSHRSGVWLFFFTFIFSFLLFFGSLLILIFKCHTCYT